MLERQRRLTKSNNVFKKAVSTMESVLYQLEKNRRIDLKRQCGISDLIPGWKGKSCEKNEKQNI